MTITRFSSFFVKVICSLLILTFSRISYTLTISQNNNMLNLKDLQAFNLAIYWEVSLRE